MASPIKSLSAKKFLPMLGKRQSRFAEGSPEVPQGIDSARAIALALHPVRQYLKVAEVIERASDCKSFRLVPDTEKGTESLAYFGAGKYLTVFETIGGIPLTRAYSISSSPKNSLEGFYELTIKRVDGGLMSNYILSNWQVGSSVEVSAPSGNFEYQPLRDAGTVICLAGGSGITPFVSMANAVSDGDEDFNLVLLYGSRNPDNILFREELDALEKKCDKIKIVHVLSDTPDEDMPAGAEKGFITADLIKKYAPADGNYSVFICGPQQMYDFLEKETAKLGIERKFIRREMFGEVHNPASLPGYPSDVPEEVSITVTIQDETKTVKGKSYDSVMQILEKNGIAVPARCRSGECGFCHSHLLSGEVYVPESLDYRRLADRQFGCIHPCCTFPLTNLEINVPAAR
ncbi:MAG: 2Fe-2S iron-sulfur cluster binding domain-containing protein [Clostridia bacterium]|nr:2Fe-2S iron-sulfur cluster binding domain-containing protein [Clostridia bacterium]